MSLCVCVCVCVCACERERERERECVKVVTQAACVCVCEVSRRQRCITLRSHITRGWQCYFCPPVVVEVALTQRLKDK